MLATNPILWWTLQNLAASAILACLAWLACHWLKPGPAARHALWLVVLLKLLTPPLVAWPWAAPNWFTPALAAGDRSTPPPTLHHQAPPLPLPSPVILTPSPTFSLPQAPQPMPPSTTSHTAVDAVPLPRVAPPRTPDTQSPAGHKATELIPLLAGGVWLAGSVVFAAIQAARVIRLRLRLRHSRPAGALLCGRLQAVAHRLGVPCIEIRLVAGIGSPLIFALLRPCLLWPEELGETIPEESERGLIVHELAHVKRRDHWVGWLELLAGCAWWWNPLYWYVRHQLRENAELACDAWVVGTLPRGRRAYAEALLAVCESMSRPTVPMPALGVGTGSRRFLRRRLTMIIQEHVPFRLSRIGLMVTVLLAILNVPAWSQKAPDDPNAPANQPVRPERYQRIIDQRLRLQASQQALTETLAVEQEWAAKRTQAAALPDAAREVVERYEKSIAEARDQFEKENERQRIQAITRLENLADTYAASGLAREAAAVRAAIQRIKTGDASADTGRVLPDPGNLAQFRDRVGQTFNFRVTGSVDGIVWGTDIYTDDSTLALAAVHAGLVKPGEQAMVKVRILEPADSYAGSTRNGVDSNPYGQWFGSFRFESAAGAGDARLTPLPPGGTFETFRGQDNQVINVEVTGSTVGTIWGDGVYTDDSPVAVAAVHAGVLRDGESGVVAVTIRPGRDRYAGSVQNGVTSTPYGGFPGSYEVKKSNIAVAAPRLAPAPALSTLRGHVGEVLYIELTGSTTGVVWGSDLYTDDSSLAAAAVHAGVLKDGESGIVKITIAPADDAYTGSTRNGVETQNYGEWGGSFRIERVPPGFTPPKVYHGVAPARLQGYGPARVKRLNFEFEGLFQDKDR